MSVPANRNILRLHSIAGSLQVPALIVADCSFAARGSTARGLSNCDIAAEISGRATEAKLTAADIQWAILGLDIVQSCMGTKSDPGWQVH